MIIGYYMKKVMVYFLF